MKLLTAVLSDAGKVRRNNEDSCFSDDDLGLLIVADGMGGHAAGEVASQLAVQIIRDSGQASASFLQRRLRIGYNRAARLIETMEAKGIVGPADGSKSREILIR